MGMSTTMTYGGWVSKRPAATGGSLSLTHLIGWVAAFGAALGSIGTGGELSIEHLQQASLKAQYATPFAEVAEVAHVRTPSEDLARIREVLSPAISDLATTFRVTRQSVYNWLNGEPVADENAAKLRDLAQAADVLAHEGIAVNAALLKRKFANGKTLMQVAQAGESARESALLLVQIHKHETEQRERMTTRFANRAKTPATADFDLPASGNSA
jgi:transcriptional regulator with XRE-family HTH domain